MLYDYISLVLKPSADLSPSPSDDKIEKHVLQGFAPYTQNLSNLNASNLGCVEKKKVKLTVVKSVFSPRPSSFTSASTSLSLDEMSSKATNTQAKQYISGKSFKNMHQMGFCFSTV